MQPRNTQQTYNLAAGESRLHMGHAALFLVDSRCCFLPAGLKNKNTKGQSAICEGMEKYKVYFWKGWKNTKKTYKNTRCNCCSYFVFFLKKIQNNYKHVQNKNKMDTNAISQNTKYKKYEPKTSIIQNTKNTNPKSKNAK